MDYEFVISDFVFGKAKRYLKKLQAGGAAGGNLAGKLREGKTDLSLLEIEMFLEILVNTKYPQIFAESQVEGDGRDWNLEELSILGDIGVAVPVMVFDDGLHANPRVHQKPFKATLLFTPGALLQSLGNNKPADWEDVIRDGQIDFEAYYGLYERRLLPLFRYANKQAEQSGGEAFITIPGIGCGQFAGPFRGSLGSKLRDVFIGLLEGYGKEFKNIKAIYYDPYKECANERLKINGIDFLVRPLMDGNQEKPQLCRPENYEEEGDNFKECEMFSFVAWDHVSWPGNDFYPGSRATDDGVKAAATDSMRTITKIAGSYNKILNQYNPPLPYKTWNDVVIKRNISLKLRNNLVIL